MQKENEYLERSGQFRYIDFDAYVGLLLLAVPQSRTKSLGTKKKEGLFSKLQCHYRSSKWFLGLFDLMTVIFCLWYLHWIQAVDGHCYTIVYNKEHYGLFCIKPNTHNVQKIMLWLWDIPIPNPSSTKLS